MVHLVNLVSIYLYNILIILFLFECYKYISAERTFDKKKMRRANIEQRSIIYTMLVYAGFVFLFHKPPVQVITDFTIILVLFNIMSYIFRRQYKNNCNLLHNAVLFLISTSIIILYRINPDTAMSQLKWFTVGFSAVFVLFYSFPYIKKWSNLWYVYLVIGFILIILPTFLAESTYGALNWISLFGIKFQPSEVVKFLFIFYLASFFIQQMTLKKIIFVIATGVCFVVILASQNDYGAALIFFMTFMIMLYVSTGSKILFGLGLLSASTIGFFAFHIVPHVETRLNIWKNPWADPYGSGHQIINSLFAMGSYAPFGSGLNNGSPYYIPVVESDFIYAGITEEFGGIFALGTIAIYIIIFYRGTHIALRSKERFFSLLAIGITSLLAFQTFLIIGGVTKFIPLTGVTMPFVSYGGTSLTVSIIMFAMLQLIYINTKEDEREIRYTNVPYMTGFYPKIQTNNKPDNKYQDISTKLKQKSIDKQITQEQPTLPNLDFVNKNTLESMNNNDVVKNLYNSVENSNIKRKVDSNENTNQITKPYKPRYNKKV